MEEDSLAWHAGGAAQHHGCRPLGARSGGGACEGPWWGRGGRSITYVRPRFDTNRSWIVVTEFTPTPSNWVPSMIAGWLVGVSFAKHHPKLPFYFSPTHSTKLRFGAQTRGRIRLLFF